MSRRLSALLDSLTPDLKQKITARVQEKGLANWTKNEFFVMLATECPELVLAKSAAVSNFMDYEFDPARSNSAEQTSPSSSTSSQSSPPPPPPLPSPPSVTTLFSDAKLSPNAFSTTSTSPNTAKLSSQTLSQPPNPPEIKAGVPKTVGNPFDLSNGVKIISESGAESLTPKPAMANADGKQQPPADIGRKGDSPIAPTKNAPPPPPIIVTAPTVVQNPSLGSQRSPVSLPANDGRGVDLKRSTSARGFAALSQKASATSFKYYRALLPPELGGWYFVHKSDSTFSPDQVQREILTKLIVHRKLAGLKLGEGVLDMGVLEILLEEREPLPPPPDYVEMGLWISARFEQSLGFVPPSFVRTAAGFEGVPPAEFLDNSAIQVAVTHAFHYDLRPSLPDKDLSALFLHQVRLASSCSTYLASLILQEYSGATPATITMPTYLVTEEIRRWVMAYHGPTQDCSASALAAKLRMLDGFCELSKSLRATKEFELDSKLLVILLQLEDFVTHARPPVINQLARRSFAESMEQLSMLSASILKHGILFLYMCARDQSHLPEVLPTALDSLYKARLGQTFDQKSNMKISDWTLLQRLMTSQAGCNLALLLDSEAVHHVIDEDSDAHDAMDELELCLNPFIPCSFANFVGNSQTEQGGLLAFFCQSPSTGFAFARMHAILFEIAKISLIARHCSDVLFNSASAANGLLKIWAELMELTRASVLALGLKSQQFFQSWQLAAPKRLLSQPLIKFLSDRLLSDVRLSGACLGPIETSLQTPLLGPLHTFARHLQGLVRALAEPEDAKESMDAENLQAAKYAHRAQELLLKGQCVEGTKCLRGGLDLCPRSSKLRLGFAEAIELQQYASGEFLRKNEELHFARRKPPIDDQSLSAICKHLVLPPCCWTLGILELDDNEITPTGAQQLFMVLPNCPSLKRLSMPKNHLGQVGAAALAGILNPRNTHHLRSLQHLDISSTLIPTSGAVALSHALGLNTTLKTLDCGYNPLEDEGVKVLVAAVAGNRHLSLDFFGLNSTGMGNKSAVALTLLLNENKTIDMSLGEESLPTHPGMEREVWTEIKRLLRANRSRMPFVHKTSTAYSLEEQAQMGKLIALYHKIFGDEKQIPDTWKLIENEDGDRIPSYQIGLHDFLRSRWLFASPYSSKPFFQAVAGNVVIMLSALCTFQTQRQRHFAATVSDRLLLNDPIALVCEEFKVWLTKDFLSLVLSHSTPDPQVGARVYGRPFQTVVDLPVDNNLLRSLRGRRTFLRSVRKLEDLKNEALSRLVDQLDVSLTQCLRVSELFWVNDSLIAAVHSTVGLGRALVFTLIVHVRNLADLPENCPALTFPSELGRILAFIQKMFNANESAGPGAVSLYTFLKSIFLPILFPDAGLPPFKVDMTDFDRSWNPFFTGTRFGGGEVKEKQFLNSESPRPKQPPASPKSPGGRLNALKAVLKRPLKDEGATSPKEAAAKGATNPSALTEADFYSTCGLAYEIGRVTYFLMEGRDLLLSQPAGRARLALHMANLVRLQSGLAKLVLDALTKFDNKNDLSGLQPRPSEILEPILEGMSYYDVLRFLDRIVDTEQELGSLEIDDENQGARLDLSTWEPGLPEAMAVQVWKECVRKFCAQCNTVTTLPTNLIPPNMFLHSVTVTEDPSHQFLRSSVNTEQREIRRLLKAMVLKVQDIVPDPATEALLIKQVIIDAHIQMDVDNGEVEEIPIVVEPPPIFTGTPDKVAESSSGGMLRSESVLRPRATSRVAQNMEGWLWKLTRDSAFPRWVRRYFVLKDHCLAYWDSDKEYKQGKPGKRPLSLLGGTCLVCGIQKWKCQNCECILKPAKVCVCGHDHSVHVSTKTENEVQLPKGKYSFSVTLAPSMSQTEHASEKISYFGVQSMSEMDEWVHVIQVNCDEKSLQHRSRKRSSLPHTSPLQSLEGSIAAPSKTKIFRKPPTVLNLLCQRIVQSNVDDDTIIPLAHQMTSSCDGKLSAFYIDLSFNQIGSVGIVSLMGIVSQNALARVVRLALRCNSIGSKGVETISKHLTSVAWFKLTHLDVNSNAITAAGVKFLADTLSEGSLTYLDLGYNPIGDLGVNYLAAALKDAPLASLKTLHLGGCDVSSAAARGLRTMLNYNINLTALFLHENSALDTDLAESIGRKLSMRTARIDSIASFLWSNPLGVVPGLVKARTEIVHVDVRTYCRRCEKHFEGILKARMGSSESQEHTTELTKLLRLFPCKVQQCSSLFNVQECERSYVRVLELLALASLLAFQLGGELKGEKAEIQHALFEGDFRHELSDWFAMLAEQAGIIVSKCAKSFGECFEEEETVLRECSLLLHSTVEEYFQHNHAGDYKLSPQFIKRFEDLRGSSQWFNYLQTTALHALFPRSNSSRPQALVWKEGIGNARGEEETHPELLLALHATCEIRLAPLHAVNAYQAVSPEQDEEDFVLEGFHGGKMETNKSAVPKTTAEIKANFTTTIDCLKALVDDLLIVKEEMCGWFDKTNFDVMQFFELRYHAQFLRVMDRTRKGLSVGECLAWMRFVSWYEQELQEVEAESSLPMFQPYLTDYFQMYLSKQVDTTHAVVKNAIFQEREDPNSAQQTKGIWFTAAPSDIFELVGSTVSSMLTLPRQVLSHSNLLKLCMFVTSLLATMQHEQQQFIESAVVSHPKQLPAETGDFVWFPGDKKRPKGYILAQINNATNYEQFFEDSVANPLLEKFDESDKPTNSAQQEKEADDRSNIEEYFYDCGAAFMDLATSAMEITVNLLLATLKASLSKLFSSGMSQKFWLDVSKAAVEESDEYLCAVICQQITEFCDVIMHTLAEESKARALIKIALHRVMANYAQAFIKAKPAVGKHHNFVSLVRRDMAAFQKCFEAFDLLEDDLIETHTMHFGNLVDGFLNCEDGTFFTVYFVPLAELPILTGRDAPSSISVLEQVCRIRDMNPLQKSDMLNRYLAVCPASMVAIDGKSASEGKEVFRQAAHDQYEKIKQRVVDARVGEKADRFRAKIKNSANAETVAATAGKLRQKFERKKQPE